LEGFVEPYLKLKEVPCPICGSSDRRVVGVPGKMSPVFEAVARDVASVRVVRCLGCTGAYISPMVYYSENLLSSMYNATSISSDMKNMGEKRLNLRIAERHSRGTLKGKRLLDIGSGTGEYLLVGREMAMDVTGMDVDDSLVEALRARHGFKVVKSLLSEDTFPAASFDIVVLSHVIEHLQDPGRMLRLIRGVLRPDGLLIMTTPNADSLMELLHEMYGRARRGWDKTFVLTPFTSPYHILGFNLRCARVLLDREGFTPVYAKARSGLEWKDGRLAAVMKVIKVAGAFVGRGMSLTTVSRLS
jgi:SAM-dependent methyltransferase